MPTRRSVIARCCSLSSSNSVRERLVRVATRRQNISAMSSRALAWALNTSAASSAMRLAGE
ncbi:MAG TPA: hypothetical protein VIY28_10950 [Pseudonocardiaceae bacterium]